ncbi:MAG TPA: hypothetical protein VKN99_05500 [Polyangia bacterium]|nr:hypothetical protein [Polyangia bacterium]
MRYGGLPRSTVRSLCALIAALGFGRAHATVFVRIPTERMVAMADTIVLAQVAATQSRWDHGRIVTRVALTVEFSIKGVPGHTLVVEAPGGKVGDIAMRVLDGPEFRAGERAIVFLTRSRPGDVHRVLNLSQGKLAVVRDTSRGDLVTWVPPGTGWVETTPLAQVVTTLRALARRDVR